MTGGEMSRSKERMKKRYLTRRMVSSLAPIEIPREGERAV